MKEQINTLFNLAGVGNVSQHPSAPFSALLHRSSRRVPRPTSEILNPENKMVDGSTIAAILTGVLALAGAVASAWMSGWNEQRSQERKNRKVLVRYAMPLLIAAWDLANWFDDILNDDFYSPEACEAYGDGWNTQFTSYLIGQYLAGIHILREQTYFLAHLPGTRVHKLKKLLWKIQNEFISMHYTERQSRGMRWSEGDMLAVQEHMTIAGDLSGEENVRDLRTMPWVEFQQNYALRSQESNDDKSLELKTIFEWYETEFQRIVYRRFKYLYTIKWPRNKNPQQATAPKDTLITAELIQQHREEDERIEKEQKENPDAGLIVPDWRIRRLQHLLCDLIKLLDDVSGMKFNRPIKKCGMDTVQLVPGGGRLDNKVPCDCSSTDCNPGEEDFKHRQLTGSGRTKDYPKKDNTSNPGCRAPTRQGTLGLESKEAGEGGSSQNLSCLV